MAADADADHTLVPQKKTKKQPPSPSPAPRGNTSNHAPSSPPPPRAAGAVLAPSPTTETSIEPLGPPPAGVTPGVVGEFSDVALWSGSRRLQTQTFDLAEDTVCIRSLDWDRDRFDIEFGCVW
jgi:hypothetical protein